MKSKWRQTSPQALFYAAIWAISPPTTILLFLSKAHENPGFNHAAFEVLDINEVMRGHEHLKAQGREASWGIGRHILGSQIFDYWRGLPGGTSLSTGPMAIWLTAADGSNRATLDDLLAV